MLKIQNRALRDLSCSTLNKLCLKTAHLADIVGNLVVSLERVSTEISVGMKHSLFWPRVGCVLDTVFILTQSVFVLFN